MSLAEYRSVVVQIARVLAVHNNPPVEFRVTRPLANTTEFGHVDVLVDDVDAAVAALRPAFVAKRGHVTSVSWIDLLNAGGGGGGCGCGGGGTVLRQVDLIATTIEGMEHAWLYLSYGMFGMCVGVCLERRGLVFSLDGLEAVVDDRTKARVLLSSDAEAILGFLGIDARRLLHQTGLADESDLVATLCSPSSVLDVERLSQEVRRETKHRILKRYELAAARLPSTTTTNAPSSLTEAAIERFGKQAEVAAVREPIDLRRRIAGKVNGRVVTAATGIEAGAELGRFIAAFRKAHADADIDAMSHADVMGAMRRDLLAQ